MISTAVDRVALDFGTPAERWLDRIAVSEARRYLDERRHFAEGSMAPKVRAAISFVERRGGDALITSPEVFEEALAGRAGTRLVPDPQIDSLLN